jgi:hypothetical protein
MKHQGAILIGITSFNLLYMVDEITQENPKSEKSRLFCPLNRSMSELFFSLVDYRNNYFTSEDPDKIIEFYNGFKNSDQLIQWMRERPKGVVNIHEVDGDKDIIVVIPTADFNGKYAKECRENIFKGLHIIFVESGEVPDPYFNYAHNCNVGIRKAMEYNPKWIVLSNDDMNKIDHVKKLIIELNGISELEFDIAYLENKNKVVNLVRISLSTNKRRFFFRVMSRQTRIIIYLEKKFKIKYLVSPLKLYYSWLYDGQYNVPAIGDFAIFSTNLLSTTQFLFDETYINGGEDVDASLSLYFKGCRYKTINYDIASISGGTIGKGGRMLRDLSNLAYLNYKIENSGIFDKKW